MVTVSSSLVFRRSNTWWQDITRYTGQGAKLRPQRRRYHQPSAKRAFFQGELHSIYVHFWDSFLTLLDEVASRSRSSPDRNERETQV